MGWNRDRWCFIFFCFRDTGLVDVQTESGIHTVQVADVCPGDRVRTSAGFQPVVYVHRGGHSQHVIDVQFETPHGQRGGIGLTQQHLIYTTGDEMKKAQDLRVGDPIQVRGEKATVTAIAEGAGGVRSLITAPGDVLVNGVRVSSYAFDRRLHCLTQGVAWLGRVDDRLPDCLCQASAPVVMRWVLPLLFEDAHEAKRAMKLSLKQQPDIPQDPAPGLPKQPQDRLGRLGVLHHLVGSLSSSAV